MNCEQKVDQSPSSTFRSDEESSFFTEAPSFLRTPLKRFNRSNSNSRSKSRQEQKEGNCSRFFVKNIFNQQPISPTNKQLAQKKIVRSPDRNGKRESTPSKSKTSIKEFDHNQINLYNSFEKQLEWLRLEARCQLAEAQNLQLQQSNKMLEEKISEMQLQTTELIHQKLFYQEKVRFLEQKDKKDPKQRTNNLIKLKKEIAKQKETQGAPPIQVLQQRLQISQHQLQTLRQSLSRSEKLRKQALSFMQSHKSERELFLQDLVQHLKQDLSEKDKIIDKIKIQLNIFMVRQAKQQDRVQMMKNEQLQNLKRKYGNILKKYHQVTQQLATCKKKQQRTSQIFAPRSLRVVENSLSLSP